MEKVFSEVQRFRQWWMWSIILFVDAGLVVTFFWDKVVGSQEPVQWWEYLLIAGTLFMLTLLFLIMNLSTRIDEQGIHIRFSPFHFREKHFYWRDIAKAYIRNYSPLWEYGGWGIKYGSGGKAYNVSGSIGLQLELKNGKCILIGTDRPDQLKEVILKFGFDKL